MKAHGAETVIANSQSWGIDAYAVPVHDLDADDLYDTIWDLQIPKATGGGTVLDLDVESADTDPDFEPGEIDWNAVYDWESGPERLYKARGSIGAADVGSGLGATGAFTHFLPRFKRNIKIRPGGRAKVATVVMFALSSPVLDRTTATGLTMPTEAGWLQLQLLRDTAIDALKSLVGLTEAGAETPYVDALTFLENTLAPDAFEETANQWGTGTWELTCTGKIVASVPGTLSIGRLASE